MRLSSTASCVFHLAAAIALPAMAADALPPSPMAWARAAAQPSAPPARPVQSTPRAGAKRAAATTADTTPPVITSFGLPASVTMGKLGQYMPFTFKGSDDLSGLNYVYAVVTSPSGLQQLELGLSSFFGELRSDRRSGFYLIPNEEPGLWQLQSVKACDLSLNCTELTGSALQTIKGRHQVEIKNDFYDVAPPTLSQGLLTVNTEVGLRGVVVAEVGGQDTGTPRASGVWGTSVELCRLDGSFCLSVSGGTWLPDLVSATTRGGSWIQEYWPGGTYHLKAVTLSDFNGNVRTYTSTLFGGDTDFTPLFNVTSLSL